MKNYNSLRRKMQIKWQKIVKATVINGKNCVQIGKKLEIHVKLWGV